MSLRVALPLALAALAAAADPGRRLELQVFNNSGGPLTVASVRSDGIWLPGLEPRPGQTVTTARPATWGLAPRKVGGSASATVTLQGAGKASVEFSLSVPSLAAPGAKGAGAAGLAAGAPTLVSSEGSRWVYRASVFSPEEEEAKKPKPKEPTWRDGLSNEQIDHVVEALDRGRTKARVCFTVFDSPSSEPVEAYVVVDGGKGFVAAADILEPYDGQPIESCLKRAFVGEAVLPFEGRRRMRVSLPRPPAPKP